MIAKGQAGPIIDALASRPGRSKDIFHEYALDYAKKVNDMTGGDLKIEVLPAGAVVPAFGLLDAVSKGTLDGGHGVLVYHYGKQNALALWGSGPAFGMDANMLLSWHKYGGGKELLTKLYASIGANVVSFPYGPMATQPLGWFKKPITKVGRLQGPQVPHRRHLDRPVHRHGRGGQRAARRRDRAGDGPRPARRGGVQQRDAPTACSASRTCPRSACCRASTRTPSSSRSRSTRPSTMRCRRRCGRSSPYAVDARVRGHDLEGDRPLLEGLRRAADQGQGQVLQDARRDPEAAARVLYDKIVEKKSADNPIFKEIVESQKTFAERAVQLGHGQQREPADGVRPLLRRQEAAGRRPDAGRKTEGTIRDCCPGWCLRF